jgi:hypothetical protein
MTTTELAIRVTGQRKTSEDDVKKTEATFLGRGEER